MYTVLGTGTARIRVRTRETNRGGTEETDRFKMNRTSRTEVVEVGRCRKGPEKRRGVKMG